MHEAVGRPSVQISFTWTDDRVRGKLERCRHMSGLNGSHMLTVLQGKRESWRARPPGSSRSFGSHDHKSDT